MSASCPEVDCGQYHQKGMSHLRGSSLAPNTTTRATFQLRTTWLIVNNYSSRECGLTYMVSSYCLPTFHLWGSAVNVGSQTIILHILQCSLHSVLLIALLSPWWLQHTTMETS